MAGGGWRGSPPLSVCGILCLEGQQGAAFQLKRLLLERIAGIGADAPVRREREIGCVASADTGQGQGERAGLGIGAGTVERG